MKKKEHLPIFGIGPFLVAGMALVTVIAAVIFCYILSIGTLNGFAAVLLRIIGIAMVIAGVMVWFIGAACSGMDGNIKENRLKTDGIYAWVRNPMYSGCWILISGLSLMWHNICLIPVILINWGIMTIVLKNTEEKWLYDLYGQEYKDYCKRVKMRPMETNSVKKRVPHKSDTRIEILYVYYLGKTFLRKGSFPKPLFQKLLA